MNDSQPTRDQQREAARAKARSIRESQHKRATLRRFAMTASILTAILVVGSAIALAALNQSSNTIQNGSSPTNAIFNGGVRIGKDLKVITSKDDVDPSVHNIIIWQDPQCVACHNFEVPVMPQLRELVRRGSYTLEIHPISFMDGYSANEYSSRAASALLCVAESSPNQFFDYNEAQYNNWPEEGSAGPSSEELAKLAQSVGVSSGKALACIKSNTWARWAKSSAPTSDGVVPGTNAKFTGTPFIYVNGTQLPGTNDAGKFLQMLQQVAPLEG